MVIAQSDALRALERAIIKASRIVLDFETVVAAATCSRRIALWRLRRSCARRPPSLSVMGVELVQFLSTPRSLTFSINKPLRSEPDNGASTHMLELDPQLAELRVLKPAFVNRWELRRGHLRRGDPVASDRRGLGREDM